MLVTTSFKSKDFQLRNNNTLDVVSCDDYPGCVVIRVMDTVGVIETESIVEGEQLIKAIENALNVC